MSIAGRWKVTMPTPIGIMQFAWEFAEVAGSWEGRMIGQAPVSNSQLRSVRVSGDSVTFETTTASPMGAIELAFAGTISNGSIIGTCQTRFGDNLFSAVRA